MSAEQPVTILLVEDDPGHARLIERNLRRALITNPIVTLSDGQQAVDYLWREYAYAGATHVLPLLLLLDLNLPGLDGAQVLARIKADARTKHIPVIILIVQEFAFFASVLADGWGRVRKRRCLGEGPMTGWLWQPGRGTTKLSNTPTPQIGADRCMQKSLPVGTFLNRSLPSIGRGLNRSVLATIRPTTMTLSTRCSGVGILTR